MSFGDILANPSHVLELFFHVLVIARYEKVQLRHFHTVQQTALLLLVQLQWAFRAAQMSLRRNVWFPRLSSA